jgi:diketogulonate reductase-like aldo/keto reductase
MGRRGSYAYPLASATSGFPLRSAPSFACLAWVLAQTLAQSCAIGLFRKASNQVQFSPFEFRRALLETCDRRGVAPEAYSPHGTGRHLGDRRVAAMAERLGRTPAQVLIRWSLQRDLVVLPKSTPRAYRAKRAGLRLSALG